MLLPRNHTLTSLVLALLMLSGCSNPELQQDPRTSKYAPLLDGDYKKAVQTLDADLQHDPDSLSALYARATVEVEGGNVEDGIVRLDRLLERYPKYAFGYSERARAHFKAGHYESAITDADLAIRYRPDTARSYVRRALPNLLLHNPDKALADLQTAQKLAPNEDAIFVKVLTAGALMEMKRYQEALPLLNEAVKSAPKDARPYYQRAACYAHMKDWKNAMADSDKSLQLKPGDQNMTILHAALLSATNQREAARKQYLGIMKQAPDAKTVADIADMGSDVPSITDAGLACLSAGNAKLAKAILTRAQARRPLDATEVFAMAKSELALNDMFRAAKLLNECLAAQPTWGEPRVALIKLYLKDNLPQKAREVQKEGLQLPLSPADRKMVASAI